MPRGVGKAPADKRGLFANRAYRRLAEIVDLPGQHAGDPAGEEQGQVARRVVGLWADLTEGRNRDDRRGTVNPAQRVRVMVPSAKVARVALAEDQIGRLDRCPRCSRITRHDRLAPVEMARERSRSIAVY